MCGFRFKKMAQNVDVDVSLLFVMEKNEVELVRKVEMDFKSNYSKFFVSFLRMLLGKDRVKPRMSKKSLSPYPVFWTSSVTT